MIVILLLILELFFLDVSKAFDRAWHEGLIYKIKCMGITGLPLKLIQSFLNNRLQRVVLIGQTSAWTPVLAGVPQGSILGPLFFLIYINDLTKGISSTAKLFADDTSIFSVANDINVSADKMNKHLEKISILKYPNRIRKLPSQRKIWMLPVPLFTLIKLL